MKTVRFVMTGPPTADAGSFVGIVDDDNNPVSVGWWEHDGEHWVYVMPVRMVPELIVASGQSETGQHVDDQSVGQSVLQPPQRGAVGQTESLAMRKRRELKERVKGMVKKEVGAAADPVAVVPPHWELCPGCSQKFDPQKDELLDCSLCGDSKCTARCMPNPVDPCLDCQALIPEKGEGFDRSVAPPNATLFDDKFHADPKAVARAQAAEAAGELEIADEDES